jgi:hypothetical protein
VEADDTRKELREEEDLLRAAEEGSHDLLTRDPTRVSPTHIQGIVDQMAAYSIEPS